MGCDYHIYIYLEIEHINGVSYYQFLRLNMWFPEQSVYYDTDDSYDSNYSGDNEYNNMVQRCLKCRKDLVIYNEGKFKNEFFEKKYLPVIQNKINKIYKESFTLFEDTGTLNDISEIIKVTRKEIRNDRFDPIKYFQNKDYKKT